MGKTIDKDWISHFHDNGLYGPTRTIELSGDSEDEDELLTVKIVRQFKKNIHILDNNYNPEKPINVLMELSGGEVELGMSIYDNIRVCQNFVRIVVSGKAYSMGSIILQAADERVMTENAKLMIHMGEFGDSGHPKKVEQWFEDSKRFDKWMKELYLKKIKEKKPRFKAETLQKWLDFDKIFTAEEALEYGLIDRIERSHE